MKFKNALLILLSFSIFVSGFLTAWLIYSNGELIFPSTELQTFDTPTTPFNSDEKFLENHVYGAWKITDQIAKLDETGLDFNKSTTNIKNIKYGVLDNENGPIFGIFTERFNPIYTKSSVITSYRHPLGETPVYFDVDDLYLFGLYGGFNLDVINPNYQISTIIAKDAIITDLTYSGVEEFVDLQSVFNIESIIKITYDLGETDSFVKRRNFGDILYVIDENDRDTLYLDFCGLWEMKRAEPNDEIPSSTKSRGSKG